MTRGSDITRLRTRGSRLRGELLELRVSQGPEATPRIGLIVPRHKHTAVERNKVKRRLREMLRVIHNSAPLAGDAIVVAGPRAYAASFEALRDELDVIWRRAASRVGPA